MVISSYTGPPQVKISQKVLGGATFLTHTVHLINYKTNTPNAVTNFYVLNFGDLFLFLNRTEI